MIPNCTELSNKVTFIYFNINNYYYFSFHQYVHSKNFIKHEVNAHVQNNMTSVSGGLFLVAAAAASNTQHI